MGVFKKKRWRMEHLEERKEVIKEIIQENLLELKRATGF